MVFTLRLPLLPQETDTGDLVDGVLGGLMVVARHPAATVVIVDGGEVGAGGVGGEAAVLVSVGVVGVDDGLSAVRWSKNVVGVTGAGLVVKADSFAMECS